MRPTDLSDIADAMERIRNGTHEERDWDDYFSFSWGDEEVDAILIRADNAGLFDLMRHGPEGREEIALAVDACIRDLRNLGERRRSSQGSVADSVVTGAGLQIADDEGRDIYEAIKAWLSSFDPGAVIVEEEGPTKNYAWAIRIHHVRPGPSKATVVWEGGDDPTQVNLGEMIWIDRLPGDPEFVLPYLEAAANGRVTEKVWRDEFERVSCSRAEIEIEGKMRKVSYGGGLFWKAKDPDQVFVYESWPRKP